MLLPDPESPVNQRIALLCPLQFPIDSRSTEALCQTIFDDFKVIDFFAIVNNSSSIFQKALKAQSYVDGFGANRVVETIYPSKKNNLTIREACDSDIFTYFNWVNNPLVRSSAFNSNTVDIEQHQTWYKKQLNDSNSYLFVL